MSRAAKSDAQTTFEFIAEHTSDVIVRVDQRGILTYVSPSIRVYGYQPEDIIGTTGIDLFHPDDRDKVMATTIALLSGQPAPFGNLERRFRRADGGWIWVEGSPHVVFDAAGAPTEMINVFRDVSYRRDAEAAAREHAQLFETAFQHSAIGKCLVDLDGRFLRVNPALCRLTGYSEAQLLAMHDADLAHIEDGAEDRPEYVRLIAGEIDSYSVERRSRRADGTYVWVNLTVAVVRNVDGAPKHLVVEVLDMTSQLKAKAALEQSEARYRLIAENTSDIICMSDAGARITYLSPSVRQLGFQPDDLIGSTFVDHVHAEDAGRMWGILMRQTRASPVQRIRWRARHKSSGDWLWMESVPTRLWDAVTGEATGFLDVIRDVSVQVAQEEALARARAEAEAATSVKSQFLANMSHEIRTPLTAVLGYTDILKGTPSLDGKVRSYVERISGGGAALLAIVNDILDFSKLEAGMVDVRPRATDIARLAEDAAALFEARAAEKGLSLGVDLDPALPSTVLLDPDRLRQIMVNLLGNAMKFTEHGSVTLRVAILNGGLRFEVEDTGPGLSDDQCARLFQRFNQIDGSTTRQHGGTGLGLAICKGLAEAMGGAVGVTSTPGKGSSFHLSLPLTMAVTEPAATAQADIGVIAGLSVLVVDDNATNRELARKILEAFGAEVTESDGGADALDQLAGRTVDVVLMDLRMPGVDGREALRRLRAVQGPNRHTPVLAFTADAEVNGGSGLDSFDGVIRKPIEPLAMAASVALAASGPDQVNRLSA